MPDDLALVADALGVPSLDARALCDDLGEGDDGFRVSVRSYRGGAR